MKKRNLRLLAQGAVVLLIVLLFGGCGAPATVEYNSDRTKVTVTAPCDPNGYPHSECMMRDFYIKLAKKVFEVAKATPTLKTIEVKMICKVDRKDEYGNPVKFDNPKDVAYLTNMEYIRKFADSKAYAERVSEYRNGIWIYDERSR